MYRKLITLLIGFSLVACSPKIRMASNSVWQVVDVKHINGRYAIEVRCIEKGRGTILLWADKAYREGDLLRVLPDIDWMEE